MPLPHSTAEKVSHRPHESPDNRALCKENTCAGKKILTGAGVICFSSVNSTIITA